MEILYHLPMGGRERRGGIGGGAVLIIPPLNYAKGKERIRGVVVPNAANSCMSGPGVAIILVIL